MEKTLKWDYWNQQLKEAFHVEKKGESGFSWLVRNYRCSFCNKEFKSAQALGGHMNVHRRDRAMRLSSTPIPNPKLLIRNALYRDDLMRDKGKKMKVEIEEAKGSEFVRLDLSLGLIQEAKVEVDLELRLGYS